LSEREKISVKSQRPFLFYVNTFKVYFFHHARLQAYSNFLIYIKYTHLILFSKINPFNSSPFFPKHSFFNIYLRVCVCVCANVIFMVWCV
jgi:hypothetical protein